MSSVYTLLSILYIKSILQLSTGFNLYESSHDLRKESTHLFDRLKYYESITIKHNQFHIDNGKHAIYPMNGKIEFHAFGNYYKLLIRKNTQLFADNFVIEHHKYNNITRTMNKIQSFDTPPQCHYTAEIVSDESGITDARFSVCRGRGLQGWIYAFGETIVIRPKQLLTNTKYKHKHKINDVHIVYKYNDLDRSDYAFDCGHSHNHNHITDIFNNRLNTSKRRLQPSIPNTLTNNIRYVELAAVNDPGIIQEYGNDYEELTHKTIQSIATVQSFYLSTDWGSNVGTIQIVLSNIGFIDQFTSFGGLSLPTLSCVNGGDSPNLYQKEHSGPYCEIDYESYLESWHSYRRIAFADYDAAHLLSYFDFLDSVIGYASISGMCSSLTSGGIDQVTYDDEYNGNIIAHELGHNFGMQHDSTGNTCDPSTYIMAAKGSSAKRPHSFSTCSISYCQNFFSWNAAALSCLNNKPLPSAFAVCRNGFVEHGESCDCGQEDCTLSGDKCCDGSTCGLFAFAECSNDDECCNDCKIVDEGVICRALNEDPLSCDITQEICDGASSQCPPDTFALEGTVCGVSPYEGYCYNGICKTIDNQCMSRGHRATVDNECGYVPNWQVPETQCSDSLFCIGLLYNLDDNSLCQAIDNPLEGIPCNKTASDAAAQCVNDLCLYSTEIYTYKWTTFAWNECSIICKSNDNDIAGTQQRMVNCTLQDGTMVDDTYCIDSGDKPIGYRICNDHVCNFCSFVGICGENGDCDVERGICDCDSGYAGEFCDIEPSLTFTGIVSLTYTDVISGDIIENRANPCFDTNDSILAEYDSATATRITPIDDVDTLNELYIGSNIAVRWDSTGSIHFVAVGMLQVDAITGDALDPNYDFPFYVGNALASDDGSTCDIPDECYNDISCNDFAFTIPNDIETGYYKLIIRFNNIYNIESDILTIQCSENNCNSTGHGQCNSANTDCVCDDGWSGYSCQFSVCDNWEFAKCDGSQNECGSSIASGDIKPKCFSSQCDYTSYNSSNSSSQRCNINGCSDPHFEGFYCEIPTDYCSTLTSNSVECNNNILCESTNDNKCVYSDCYAFKTQHECEGDINGTNYISYPDSWPIFCKWEQDNINNGYCNRITCGGNVLPDCMNGAVRKALYDEYSESAQSICNGWYCDCTTVMNVEDAYWTVTDLSILLDGINDSYSFETHEYALTSQYIHTDYLSLFVCSSCSLQCENGASSQHNSNAQEHEQCIDCFFLCPQEYKPFRSGIECNQVFWILSFRVNINYNSVINNENKNKFEHLLVLDLAYFLGTDVRHISIWQIKPDGDGSIIYFRYLFDTNNDDNVQIIGGDIMVVALKEIADDTSTATRGFIMKYTDSYYKFQFCVPTKEECDPNKSIDMTAILLICFFASFCGLGMVWSGCWLLTRKKREEEYQAKVAEQKRVLREMMEENNNATRVAMRNVSRQRAKKIAADKAEKAQFEKDRNEKIVVFDATESPKAGGMANKWAQHIMYSNSEDPENGDITQLEMQAIGGDASALPKGWQKLETDDGELYYFDTVNKITQWEKPE